MQSKVLSFSIELQLFQKKQQKRGGSIRANTQQMVNLCFIKNWTVPIIIIIKLIQGDYYAITLEFSGIFRFDL